jgi:putative transposase
MGRFQVMAQALAVAGDRLVVIVSVEPDGAVMVRDLANGRVHAANPSELSAPPKVLHGHAMDEMGIASATELQWTLAQRRKEAICKIDDSQNVSRQIAAIAAEFGVSRRTVFRWHALYRESPQTSALLPRARGTPAGAHRIAAPLDELIAEVIQAVYLTKVRAKKEEVVRMVGLRCAALGLKPPSRKPILARIKELDPAQTARGRLQASEAASQTTFVPGSYQVQHALDVIQIDHTPVDAIVVDAVNRLPIGRPWLTLAIDVATRMVAGFYLSMEAPSSTSVALCLTQAVLPKENWLKSRGLSCNWPVWGVPGALHTDNGADFTAAALRRGCDEHGIRLILRPVATPHYGGHIERLIGTLMGRVHLLPGTTGSNTHDRGAYPSESNATLTMAELEQWLTLEICEQYHQRVHKGIRQSPLAAWQDKTSGPAAAARSLPEQPEQFMISFLPSMQRKLRRDGLHIFNIRYWDNVLPSIVPLGTSLLVRYDPRNLSKVYVAGPDRRYHPIPYADLALPPITLWEHRAAVSALREQGEQTPTQASIFQAVCAQRDLIERAAAKTKTARRLSQRHKDAASGTTGSSSSSKEAVDYSLPVTPADVEIWDH